MKKAIKKKAVSKTAETKTEKKWVRKNTLSWLVATILSVVGGAASLWASFQLLMQVQDKFPNLAKLEPSEYLSDPTVGWQIGSMLLGFIFLSASAILYIVWFVKAYWNYRQANPKKTHDSTLMAVITQIVPVISVYFTPKYIFEMTKDAALRNTLIVLLGVFTLISFFPQLDTAWIYVSTGAAFLALFYAMWKVEEVQTSDKK